MLTVGAIYQPINFSTDRPSFHSVVESRTSKLEADCTSADPTSMTAAAAEVTAQTSVAEAGDRDYISCRQRWMKTTTLTIIADLLLEGKMEGRKAKKKMRTEKRIDFQKQTDRRPFISMHCFYRLHDKTLTHES